MAPMFGWEVMELQQHGAVLVQALAGLSVPCAVLLKEYIERLVRIVFRR